MFNKLIIYIKEKIKIHLGLEKKYFKLIKKK